MSIENSTYDSIDIESEDPGLYVKHCGECAELLVPKSGYQGDYGISINGMLIWFESVTTDKMIVDGTEAWSIDLYNDCKHVAALSTQNLSVDMCRHIDDIVPDFHNVE
jgi:hypothetical protein